jgi:hypothetical protein
MEALRGLRHLLPGLLRQANETPTLADLLAELMVRACFAPGDELVAADGVRISEEPVVTDAMQQWRQREVMETNLGSAELRGMAQHIRNRAVFSARTTNANYLKEVANVVDDILAGKCGMAEGRYRLMRKLKELGYDPATGFPDDMGSVPPAERDSLQDLSSERRIDLLLETNVRMAQGYAQTIAGNTPTQLYAYPAWELVRLYHRDVPRGTPESHSPGWMQRWTAAGQAVEWDGAIDDRFIARKDSRIWQALGDGEGGYTDTLLNAFPPFAFRSGLAWRPVDRAQAYDLGLVTREETPAASPADLTPGQREVVRVVEDMPADLRNELLRQLGL